MKRNSGFIGSLKTIKTFDASGITELRDQHIHSQNSAWPASPKLLSHTVKLDDTDMNDIVINSDDHTIECTFEGLILSQTIYWEADQTSANDLVYTSGSFSVSGNLGSFSINTQLRSIKSDETFDVRIRTGSLTGPIIGEMTLTLKGATLSFLSSNLTERGTSSSSVQLNVNYVGDRYTTERFFLYSYTTGTGYADPATDFSSYNSGNAFIQGTKLGTGINRYLRYYDSFAVVDDYVTEGPEVLRLRLGICRGGSTTIIYTADHNYSISDTTVNPSGSITLSSSTPAEGDTLTVTYSDSNNNSSTASTLYWTANFGTATSIDIESTSGSFSLVNGSGSFSIVISEDLVSDGGETFTVEVRSLSTTGTILATSSTVTITDTPPPDPTSGFVTLKPGSSSYISTPSDTTSYYNVMDVVVPSTYSGSARIYVGSKVTASTTFYNDNTVAGIQILNSAATSILRADIFSSGTESYETTTVATSAQSSAGYPITLSAATALTYSSIANGSTVNRWNRATSTGSSYTGMADGISTGYETTILMTPDSADYTQIAQSSGTYYVYTETSGSTRFTGMTMRSPAYTFSGGEIIRVCFQFTSRSGYSFNPNDSLFVGIA
jgi:hypothetical protein